MKKIDELRNPKSCLNKAHNDEMIFVLLGRDPAAIAAIEAWVMKRIELGLNKPEDAQLEHTRMCMLTMSCQTGWHKSLSRPPDMGEDRNDFAGAFLYKGKLDDAPV